MYIVSIENECTKMWDFGQKSVLFLEVSSIQWYPCREVSVHIYMCILYSETLVTYILSLSQPVYQGLLRSDCALTCLTNCFVLCDSNPCQLS